MSVPTADLSWMEPALAPGLRVGVYGGSFDPIHVGHVDPVVAAMAQGGLDRVLYLPTARPPHKREARQAPALARLMMVELMLQGHPDLLVGARELIGEPVYTVDTLHGLQDEHPDVELVLLLGEDSYLELSKWRRWREIVAGWDILVMAREGEGGGTVPAELTEELVAHPERSHRFVTGARRAASSSELRRLLAAGRPTPAGWLGAPVLNFIRRHGLYHASSPAASEPLDAGAASDHDQERPAISSAAESTESPTASRPLPADVALAARTALDRKAEDMVLLEVAGVCDFADYFLVCTGNSDRQVGAIADSIQRRLREQGYRPLHVEGEKRANWVLLDYGDWIAHVFDGPTRDFYRLERLWDDAPRVSHDRLEGDEPAAEPS